MAVALEPDAGADGSCSEVMEYGHVALYEGDSGWTLRHLITGKTHTFDAGVHTSERAIMYLG